MARLLTTYLIGLTFGAGIVLAGMSNPAKVLNFFDFAGAWDPSLLLVMATALVITFAGYRLVLRRSAPIFETGFALPAGRKIDRRLVLGSATFGVGWGLSGFCPGGLLPVISTFQSEVLWFTGAMLAGIAIARLASRARTVGLPQAT